MSIVSRRALLVLVTTFGAGCSDASGPRTGAVSFEVVGLPATVTAAITLLGSDGVLHQVTSSRVVSGLAPGQYILEAAAVSDRGAMYVADEAIRTVRITASDTPISVSVRYALSTGALLIRADGVDAGTPVSFSLSGLNGVARGVTSGDTVFGLAPGRYSIGAGPVTTPADSWMPTIAQVDADVVVSTAPLVVSIPFRLTTGRLAVGVEGAPLGILPSIDVIGAMGTRTVTGSATITGLAPGSYSVVARPVDSATVTFVGVPSRQQVEVVAGAMAARATIRYMVRPPIDFMITGATFTQSVQSASNSIPLLAGKLAMLRAFVTASEATEERPVVRARFIRDGRVLETAELKAPAEIPLTRRDDALESTWNLVVRGELLLPGVSVVIDVDPDGRIREALESNNTWPASGSGVLDIRTPPPLDIRFVPVTQSATGATGNVNFGSAGQFVDFAYRSFPIVDVNVVVRAPFITSAAALAPTDSNGAWQQILRELQALRAAESSNATYYGVVRTPYNSGFAGFAFVGFPVAVGWDFMSNASLVMAHELGHTWGRLHAPCGVVSGTDASYPYLLGMTGSVGYDQGTARLRATTSFDLMSYCGDPWISDYTYLGVLAYRGGSAASAPLEDAGSGTITTGPVQPSLLIWGQVTARGEVMLEPAFEVLARPTLPRRGGAHSVRGVAVDGAELFALRFDAEAIADAPGANRAFAFVIPMDGAARSRLASVRASGPRGEVTRTRLGGVPVRPVRSRVNGSADRLRWDAARHPAALLRDAASGQILGIVRGGDAPVPPGRRLEVVLSDGVRSQVTTID